MPKGKVLLFDDNGGHPGMAPMIMASIAKLGFKITDVKVLLNSDPHGDHAGGLAALQQASGARLWASEASAGVIASGGLSHFVVDEELDRQVIDAIRRKDSEALAGLDPRRLQAGSSEIRNWLVVGEMARDLDLDWVEYIPGYRTPALTGTGLAFASWKTLA